MTLVTPATPLHILNLDSSTLLTQDSKGMTPEATDTLQSDLSSTTDITMLHNILPPITENPAMIILIETTQHNQENLIPQGKYYR